jgi:hypothetical protein
MIYSAIVINNSEFFTSGTIQVRIQNYFYGNMAWDLSQNTSAVTDGYDANTKTHKDFDAYVFSPIGGGKNYGMFYLPEPNTKGYVAFIGNPIERGNKCFWLGSIFEPTFYPNSKNLESINIPSDKISSNGKKADGFIDGTQNSDVYDGALVIRLKSTAVKNSSGKTAPDSSSLNWENSNTENLIVINKDKVLIHHPSAYDASQKELSYQEIIISPETTAITMSSKQNSGDIAKTTQLTLLNNGTFGFDLSVNDKNKSISSSISSIDGILSINNTIDKNVCNIIQNSDMISISYNKSSIVLDNDATISSTSGNVYVVGNKVHIGNGNESILTTTSAPGSYNFSNGLVIDVSSVIYG